MVNLAIIGDIHHAFADFDVDFFNCSSYDLILCTGDLPYHGSGRDQQIVQLLATLEKPTLLIPGNHDCVNMVQFMAEAKGMTWLADHSNPRQQQMVEELHENLDPVVLCGYSTHEFTFDGQDICILAARPLSFGGPNLHYKRYLQENFGVDSLQASVDLLCDLIDRIKTQQIIFLSHNGPTGLGDEAADIWGCDFRPSGGDYGDPDLGLAICYAKEAGKTVTAVVAGHMHHALLNGGRRQWLVWHEGTAYVNAARVPRVFAAETQKLHHHIRLQISNEDITVDEMLLADH